MLELYHHGSSVCAAKVRFALAEKGVGVDQSHYIDILAGEQFTDEYRAINPCLLYTSPSPRDVEEYRMPSSA